MEGLVGCEYCEGIGVGCFWGSLVCLVFPNFCFQVDHISVFWIGNLKAESIGNTLLMGFRMWVRNDKGQEEPFFGSDR